MRLRNKTLLACGGLVGVALLAAASSYLHWVEVRKRWTTVVEGELFQSAKMPVRELTELVLKHGLRSVIDLRDDEPVAVEAERRGLEKIGVTHKHLPTIDRPSDETIRKFVEFIAKPENRPALVHCSEGEGRSVLFAALYRIHFKGWSNVEALEATTRLPKELMFLADLIPGLARFDPVTAKGEFVLEYGRADKRQ